MTDLSSASWPPQARDEPRLSQWHYIFSATSTVRQSQCFSLAGSRTPQAALCQSGMDLYHVSPWLLSTLVGLSVDTVLSLTFVPHNLKKKENKSVKH